MTATVTRIDIAARFRHWVNAGRPPLTADETAACASAIKILDEGWRECGNPDHRPEWKP